MNKIKKLFNSFTLSKKIFALTIIMILTVYSAVAVVIYLQTKSKIEHYNIQALKREVMLLKEQIETFDLSAKDSAEKFMKIFLSMVPGIKPNNDVCDKFTNYSQESYGF